MGKSNGKKWVIMVVIVIITVMVVVLVAVECLWRRPWAIAVVTF